MDAAINNGKCSKKIIGNAAKIMGNAATNNGKCNINIAECSDK